MATVTVTAMEKRDLLGKRQELRARHAAGQMGDDDYERRKLRVELAYSKELGNEQYAQMIARVRFTGGPRLLEILDEVIQELTVRDATAKLTGVPADPMTRGLFDIVDQQNRATDKLLGRNRK